MIQSSPNGIKREYQAIRIPIRVLEKHGILEGEKVKMNREIIRHAREYIANEAHYYGQGAWFRGVDLPAEYVPRAVLDAEGHLCGTPSCVGGAILHVAMDVFGQTWPKKEDGSFHDVDIAAQMVAQMSDDQANWVFHPEPFSDGGQNDHMPTRPEVIGMLDRFLETGKVEWREAH